MEMRPNHRPKKRYIPHYAYCVRHRHQQRPKVTRRKTTKDIHHEQRMPLCSIHAFDFRKYTTPDSRWVYEAVKGYVNTA